MTVLDTIWYKIILFKNLHFAYTLVYFSAEKHECQTCIVKLIVS